MSLQQAPLPQLLQWLNDIVTELASRASQPVQPAPPQPPWMTLQKIPAPNPPATETPEQLMARAQAMIEARVGPQAPHLLPGVRMTARSDPKMAMAFAAVPARQDGVPPVNGSGRGEGMIDLGPSGS